MGLKPANPSVMGADERSLAADTHRPAGQGHSSQFLGIASYFSALPPAKAGPVSRAAGAHPAPADGLPMPGLKLGAAQRPASTGIDLPEAIEDCAVSYADGRSQDALQSIEIAIAADMLGPWTRSAWLIRFELYAQLGMKAAFDRQAMRFARLFERAPPPWPGEVAEAGRLEDLAPIVPDIAITGCLSAESQAPLLALRKTVERYEGVRLDFSRLEEADGQGCRCLLVTLQSLRRAGKQVRVKNEKVLLDILAPGLHRAQNTADPMPWLLALEILQIADSQRIFEVLAAEYAQAFGVSRPRWQGPVRPAGSPASAAEHLVLEGEVLQPAGNLLGQIERYVGYHAEVVVDMSRLDRIDFISCSQITDVLQRAAQAGRRIEIRLPNEMVYALLVLMGTGDFASIIPRH
jgi:ABC-type transporter Mla MlaB component